VLCVTTVVTSVLHISVIRCVTPYHDMSCCVVYGHRCDIITHPHCNTLIYTVSLSFFPSLPLTLPSLPPSYPPFNLLPSTSPQHTSQPQKMTIAEKMGGSPFVRDGRNVLTKLTNKAPVKKLRGENTRLVRTAMLCCVLTYFILVYVT
jgi:hypothetical protein